MMRLHRLELTAYGRFSGETVAFRRDARLHLVIGPNEAGKTTRRAAIADLLYGFEHRSDYAFRHGTSNLRVGGRVETSGAVRDLVRRKGRTQTLFDADGSPVDPGVLAAGLGGIDRATYVKLGSISHDELKDGAQILLEDEGAVASALFGAATGGFRARALLDELKERLDEIFRPQGHVYPLNRAIRSFEETQSRCRNATTSAVAWNDLARDIAQLEHDADAADHRVADLERADAALRALLEIEPKLKALDDVNFELAELKKNAVFPSESADEARELLRDLHERSEDRKTAERELAELSALHERSAPDTMLAQAYEEIAALDREAAVVRKGVDDIPGNRLLEKRDEARRGIEIALTMTWSGANLDEVKECVPTIREALAPTRRTLRRYAALTHAQEVATADLKRARREVARLRGELDGLGPAGDPAPLEAALAAADQAGCVPDEEVERLAISIAERTNQLVSDLRALGLELADPLACRDLALPLPATIDRFRTRLGEAEVRAEELADRRDAVRAAVDIRRAASASEGGAALLASGDELIALRTERDRALDGVLSAPPSASDVYVAAYRALVAGADRYADERFARASEIGAASVAMCELRREEAELAEAERHCAEHAGERTALEAEWRTARTPLLADESAPVEASARLARFHAAASLAAEIAKMGEQRDQYAALAERLATGLRAALVDAPAPAETAMRELPLRMLISLARRRLSDIELRTTQRSDLTHRLDDGLRDLSQAEITAREADAKLEAWRLEWAAAIAPFRLDSATLTPEDAPEMLEAFAKLCESWHTFFEVDERVAGIERDRDAFTARAEHLVERCALARLRDLRHDPFRTIEGLRADAAEAREDVARADERAKQIATKTEELSRLSVRIEKLVRRRDALLVPLGIAPDEAQRALERHDQHRELLDALDRLRGVIRAAQRREPEEVDAELTAHGGASGVNIELERVADELSRARKHQRALREECGAKRERQDGIRASREALDAQADAMAIGAEIERHARRYAALTAARLLLAERMEAYAAAHQGPVIDAASQLLATMTLGRYERVRIFENEAGVPVLHVVERDGGEKAIEALSEGTKDQLYLALRLATLEERLGGHSGPPLLLDDALKNFDDARTVAALRALGDFSRCVQVIYFTPRSVVADFAREALGDEGVDIVEVAA